MAPRSALTPQSFATFGELLRYLRERAEITQRELALQVGYHYSYLSRLERNERFPDAATLLARFVPALHLENDLEWATRLVELAATGRGEKLPAQMTVTQTLTESPALAHADSLTPAVPAPSPIPPPCLPRPLTPLLGRENEVLALTHILQRPEVRLLTLIGPPGVGKTRLALQTAANIAPAFERVLFVDLAPVSDPALVLPEIAQTLEIQKPAGPWLDTLARALTSQPCLLVLDNFEQIIEAASQIAALLQHTPALKILVTSREALRISGENEFPVSPLPLPDAPTLAALQENPAIQLFIQRAQAVQPSFQLTPDNATPIAEICTRLDGLPLALELAAARIKLFTPDAMLARLDKRLNWLTGGKRDDHAWRRTLRGAIEWSYRLLTSDEKKAFASLSVFCGSGSLTAVEAVCHADLDTLATLAEKSLITLLPVAEAEGDVRFKWLESLREYAREKLTEQPALCYQIHETHARYFQTLAGNASPEFALSRTPAGLKTLDQEHDNFRAALAWAIESAESPLALALCVGLTDYWEIRGHFDEGRRWLKQALALADPTPSELLAQAFRSAGWLANRQNDYAEAMALYRQSIQIWQSLENEPTHAQALMNLGMVLKSETGREDEARLCFQEALAFYRKLDEPRGKASALNQLGFLAYVEGDCSTAEVAFEESLMLRRTLGDRVAVSGSLNNLGLAAYGLGHYEQARDLHLEALALRQELGFEGQLSQSYTNLALALLHLGDLTQAEAYVLTGLEIGLRLKLKMSVVETLEALGMIEAVRQGFVRSARLLGAVECLRAQIGVGRDVVQAQDLAWVWDRIGEARESVAWQTAWAEGAGLSLEDAVRIALSQPILPPVQE